MTQPGQSIASSPNGQHSLISIAVNIQPIGRASNQWNSFVRFGHRAIRNKITANEIAGGRYLLKRAIEDPSCAARRLAQSALPR